MLKTFIGTYIPDFNSIPSAVLEKKFLENRPIRIFKVTWWLCCFPMVGGCLGTLASSTTKTGRHDIAEILLKVALKHQR
jgi:hypothetical protein